MMIQLRPPPTTTPSPPAKGVVAAFWLVVPLMLLSLVFFVLPLLVFVIYSLLTPGLFSVSLPFSIAAYLRAMGSTLNLELGFNAAAIGFMTAAISLILGLAITYWLRYRAGVLRNFVLFLITLSVFASYLVRIYAWRTILGSNGLINRSLLESGLIAEPIDWLLYNWFSVTLALVHIFLPFVVLLLYSAFLPLSVEYLEASQDLGANAPARWARVILPLVAAPALSAFMLVFILAASDYVTPQLLGGTGGQMLGVQIQANFKATGDWPLGAATSLLMLAFFLGAYWILQFVLKAFGLDQIRWS